MFLDVLGRVSNAQAFGAAAVSTDSIDLGATSVAPNAREIGTGEALGFGFVVTTAGTVANSLIEIISATDAALTAGIISHVQRVTILAENVAGKAYFIPLPQGTPTQRFLGIRVTTAAGTISGTAWLTTHSLFSLLSKAYPKAYAV
jgi:hypothetical protein